eukprot:g4850.t1
MTQPTTCAPGDWVVLRDFRSTGFPAADYDLGDPLPGQLGVLLALQDADNAIVRLLHRDPGFFTTDTHTEDLRAAALNNMSVVPALPDCVLPLRVLQRIHVQELFVNLAAFRGYVEITDNTCGAAMLTGAFNALHKLDASGDPNQQEICGRPAGATNAADELQPARGGYWPTNFNVLGRNGKWRTDVDRADADVQQADQDERTSKKAPKSLKWGLRQLHAVAAASLEHTNARLQKVGGAAATPVVQQRAKRLEKAVEELLDDFDPCTWSIGNLEVEQVVEKWKGVKQSVLASRNVLLDTPDLLWEALRKAVIGERRGGGGPGPATATTGSAPTSNATISSNQTTKILNGNPAPMPVCWSDSTQFLFHCHGVLSGTYFGHFALIFAMVEYSAEDSRHRQVLTARSYQGPRHWISVEMMHKWIYGLKFTGYEIRMLCKKK